jgi:signal transduction histidine kinase/CheY-like chemotaxis protein
MKIDNNKGSTYRKVLLLLSATSVCFFSLYIVVYFYTIEQEKQVHEVATVQLDTEINSLLELNTQAGFSTISDIAFWDEFVYFINNKNQTWFNDNIVRALQLYKADYLVVFDKEGKFIIKSSDSKIKTTNFISKNAIEALFHKRVIKYYIKIPEGYAEVYGASIHPSADFLKKQTNPVGYYFLVRLLDDSYFNNLKKITSSNINFINDFLDADNDNIIVTKDLKDWNNKTITKLVFERPHHVNFNVTKYVLLLLILTFIIHIIIFIFISKKWIYYPLNLIKNILKTEGDTDNINLLQKIPGEFGYIGNLFEENNNQRRQLEQAKLKAEESDQLKSSFLTNMSHEIRTPMNAIVGFSDLLLNPVLTDNERYDYAKVINNSGLNLVSIIEDLIQMSKIDTNQIKPNFSAIELDSFMNEIFNTLKIGLVISEKIDFFVMKTKNKVHSKIITDEVKLKQVVTNLVANALKYTKEGFVCFGYEVDEANNKIVITIKDSGIGIDKKSQAIIFDRFRRIENDFTIKAGGLGLGLAISKAYVEMLGGAITVFSTEGKGATFSFTFPIHYQDSKPETALSIEKSIANEHKENATILIAEDDNINYLLLEKIMKLKQYTIIRAKDGLEAVTICASETPLDLALMDIKMPKLNGYEALEKIKILRPNLPVIAQTAYVSVEDKMAIEAAGFSGYITKPINKENLFELIASFI